ncbi:hypothetical protein COY05_03965 [Candidatus Peregrinibacteria bacterium CG_4_10_14_0_2_um_filter_38_24]|nr:MAG: hypothetical protein COY05_03965 [Candidatus Peregrinibacteria bacterium CG_4_10_14_0_2_um_filter_38_24]PJC38711.1 MAG: hypothetical protein CO044_03550 [Candidatus Peregrinibacteria bacterium CG_4_9_14_0_2_um_filter_38_9]
MKKLLSIFFVSMFVFVGCAQKTSTTPTDTSEKQPEVSQKSAGSNVVMIADFSFAPKTITVNSGDTVVWRHWDVAAHDVVSPGLFKSPILERGKVFSFKFEKAGTYEYYCGIHPSMRGVVVVK